MTSDIAPRRVLDLLAQATKLGMSVEFDDTRPSQYCWTISSGKPYDRDQVWIFWSGPGPNGGRTSVQRYQPHARRKASRVTKMSYSQAQRWLRILAT